jgi:hypothetical protein
VYVGEKKTDRRRGGRRGMVAECSIEGVSSRADMRLTDLSLNGGFVDANVQCRPGDVVKLTIKLDGQEVTLKGRVAHVQPTVGFGFAIDSENLSDDARQLLSRYLEGVEA